MLISRDVLRVLPLFSGLRPEESAQIVQNSRLRQLKRGQFLFMHGDKTAYFYAICRGTIQIFRETPDGHEVTSDILISGNTIGEDEIVQEKRTHQSNARAVDDALLLEIPLSWMKQHLRDFNHLAPKLLANISARLHTAHVEAEHLSTMSAAQIVACYLQELCVLYDCDPHGFELPYSKSLIASRLHMELETFSRTLKKLKDHGIQVNGTHVCFSDPLTASDYVCGSCSASEDCHTRQHLSEKIGARTSQHG